MYWPFSGTSAGSGVRLLERRIRRLRCRKRAAVDAGTVEHADRARLLPQRSLPAVLGLPAAQAGRRHLEKWMRSAMRSRLEPFKRFVGMLRGHLDGNSGLDQTTVSPTVPSKA